MGGTTDAPGDVVERLARELHRRQVRYDSGPTMTEPTRTQVGGELIGLRVALGVALGYEAASGDVVPAASCFYRDWLTLGTGEGATE